MIWRFWGTAGFGFGAGVDPTVQLRMTITSRGGRLSPPSLGRLIGSAMFWVSMRRWWVSATFCEDIVAGWTGWCWRTLGARRIPQGEE